MNINEEFFKNFKRVERKAPVFEDDVCVNYTLNECFKPIFQDKYRHLIYYGGRSGEKSWGITDSLIMLARSASKTILCAREVQNSIDESVYRLWCKRIKYFGFSDFKIYQNKIVNLITGSEITFRGMNEISEKLTQSKKGVEDVDILHFDEAQNVSKNTVDVLFPSIRKPGSKIIISFNPNYDDDISMTFISNPRPRSFIKFMPFWENPFVTDETLEEAHDCFINRPEDFGHIWLGETKNTVTNAVVKHFRDDNMADLQYQSGIDVYLTCDFNVATMAWAVAHVVNDKYYYFDEICKENTTTRACAEEFLTRYREHRGKVIVTGDSSGKYRSTQSEIHNYGLIKQVLEPVFGDRLEFIVRNFNPPVEARITAFNQKIRSLKGVPELIVSSKCKQILHCIKHTRYADDGRSIYNPSLKDINNRPADKFNPHLFDAISYLVFNLSPVY